MKLKLLLSISVSLLIGSSTVFGQTKNPNFIRCTSTEHDHSVAKKYNITRDEMVNHFENWLQPLIEKNKKESFNKRNTQSILTIPVVFHVLHNGDAVGENENISDLQVQSQITVLNQDFRRMLNTPGHNTNPIGADIEVEFCLAKVDANNQFTTGIVRHQITEGTLSDSRIEAYKEQFNWDTSKYLNIYTVSFTPHPIFGETLGYAQFPLGSGLPGLEPGMGLSDLASHDGVVLNYKATGSRAIYPNGTYMNNIDAGRTATHEVGHWLGLRHIWGDVNNCSGGTDYCNDTPNHKQANYGCNQNSNSCGFIEMTENYMDYSDDACFNLFTQDQKTRIRTVLLNDPRRASLFVGNRCNYTSSSQFDLGILGVNVNSNACATVSLTVDLHNIGSQNITSAVVTFTTGSQTVTANINQIINSGSGYTLTQDLNLPVGNNVINVSITSVNGSTTLDENVSNNVGSVSYTMQQFIQTESSVLNMVLLTDEYGDETTWSFVGPGVNITGEDLDNLTSYTHNLQMTQNGCYTFTINDSESDGICCDYGDGNLSLTLNGQQIFNSGEFTNKLVFNIYKGNLSTADYGLNNSVTFYPNPTNNILNVAVKDSSLPTSYTIYNTLGQTILSKNVNNQADLAINVQTLTSGIYFIKLDKNGATQTLRFIKN